MGSLQRTVFLYLISQYHWSFLHGFITKLRINKDCCGKFPAQESQGIFQGSGRAALLQLLDLMFVFLNLASVATADAAAETMSCKHSRYIIEL